MTSDVTSIPLIAPPLQRMRLADGRTLTWQEFGAPDGRPALYFHGGGSISDEAGVFHKEAVASGIRLIAPNRPGARGSQLLPGRPVAEYSDDLRELLDHLDLERAACVGESNGGMVTLAAGATMSDRVVGGVPINPTVPWHHDPLARSVSSTSARWGYRLLKHVPWILAPLGAVALDRRRRLGEDPERWPGRGSPELIGPPPGTEPEVRTYLWGVLGDTDRQRLRPETRWATTDWGFDPYSIPVRLDFFCGVRDAAAPWALVAADANPDAAFHHFSYGHSGWAHPDARRRIIDTIAGYWT